jgi:hypothetical protein
MTTFIKTTGALRKTKITGKKGERTKIVLELGKDSDKYPETEILLDLFWEEFTDLFSSMKTHLESE